jgi:hypothetical protein
MIQTHRQAVAVVTWIVCITSCILIAASGLNYEAKAANETFLTTTLVYLPYISRQEPPTPIPTPIPTPTAIPEGVHILSNHFSYVDSIGYLNIVGEVQNNTANHLRFVKIIVNIFNSRGQLIDSDFTYIYLDNLPAGEKTCFDISLEEPAGWSYYQFESPTYRTDGKPFPNLTVLNHSGSYKPTFGWYEIVGQVRNDHITRVEGGRQFFSEVGLG